MPENAPVAQPHVHISSGVLARTAYAACPLTARITHLGSKVNPPGSTGKKGPKCTSTPVCLQGRLMPTDGTLAARLTHLGPLERRAPVSHSPNCSSPQCACKDGLTCTPEHPRECHPKASRSSHLGPRERRAPCRGGARGAACGSPRPVCTRMRSRCQYEIQLPRPWRSHSAPQQSPMHWHNAGPP